jgi:putative membrane protein
MGNHPYLCAVSLTVALNAIPMAVAAQAPPSRQPTTAPAYVAAAAASDQFEIQSSQAALQKAQSADVRSFAQMMIDHHTMTSQTLATAARGASIAAPPATLPPDKAQKVAALQNAPNTGFDALYLREQAAAHQEALAVHQAYAASGDNPALRQAASQAVPIVQQHLTRAQALAR